MTAPSHTTKPPTPLSEVFKQLGVEITALLIDLKDVEQEVSDIALPDRTLDGRVMANLQKFDRLSQTLEALAQFSNSLSRLMPPDFSTELATATDGIMLTDLANRLRECPGFVASLPMKDDGVDLF